MSDFPSSNFETARMSGTRIPRKRSPSPYSPAPDLKNRAAIAACPGRIRRWSSWRRDCVIERTGCGVSFRKSRKSLVRSEGDAQPELPGTEGISIAPDKVAGIVHPKGAERGKESEPGAGGDAGLAKFHILKARREIADIGEDRQKKSASHRPLEFDIGLEKLPRSPSTR